MCKTKISVIVPVYNVEKYVSECLDSLINQTFKEFEIICVNDGSTDNSLSILKLYAEKDNRIKIINQANGGLSAARNSGLDMAQGKYVYFLDSDDFIVGDALEKLYDISEKENLDILYFGVNNYFEDKVTEDNYFCNDTYYDRKQFFSSAVSGEELFERFLIENMFVCCVPFQFIRTEFLKNTGIRFKEKMLHEDELFSPQLIVEAKRTMVIEDKFYMRRIRSDSITTSVTTHKNFLGYFIAYTTLSAKTINAKHISQGSEYVMCNYVKKLYNTCKRIYNQLPPAEKKLAETNMPSEYMVLFNPLKEQYEITSSTSYKLGKLVTYLPVKADATLKSLKSKGIKETLKTIKKYYFK